MTSDAPATFAERDRLQRWIAAIGLVQAADDNARLDTPETNALALIGAHSACESLLGLLYGKRRYKRNEDVPLPALVADVDKMIGLDPDLADDLDAMHRMRNGFVHASNTVHANEAARAISAARRLLYVVAERSVPGVPLPSGHGVASAVATIVGVEAVGMWLRHAEELLAQGRLKLAADGCARALDSALARTRPRLHHRGTMSNRIRFTDLRRIAAGLGNNLDRGMAEFAEDLSAWVLPVALGLSPVAYEHLRSTIGQTRPVDLRGKPVPVVRPAAPPTEPAVRSAIGTTSAIVFRLWAAGNLRAWDQDAKLVELAQEFLRDPRGIAAGEIPPRPAPDRPG